MASTEVANSYTYDVFLSFRGEDTRRNFTDHLYNALRHKGIHTFIDAKLPRGEEISVELVKAIEESRVSIIIFSENYASSRWCLDELVHILQCKASNQQMVRPVFYKVDPSDVRNQRGGFGKAFAKLDECKYKDSMDKWRAALSTAANLSGWPFSDDEYESQFISKIVEELSSQVLVHSYNLEVAKYPIGIESCVQDVHKLIDIKNNNVRMVGIWGPGGIGKTTIAKAVFNSISRKFEGSCFLADVRSNSIPHLQETLLCNILHDSNLKVPNVDIGVSLIKKTMQHKKVVLILDDVSDLKQLDNLAPSSDCFGPGSRIIITTRDQRCLTAHRVDSIYKVKMLGGHRALELFSRNAFRRNRPPDDYLKLAQRAVRYAQGLPLALIVLGSHLFDRRSDEWEAILDSCNGDPQKEIQGVLRISYDALNDCAKQLFLDIACFFKGEDVDDVTPILQACGRNPTIGMKLLVEKALITIGLKDDCLFKNEVPLPKNEKKKILMHDLIEEMGKDIVIQQGEPGKRSRLWNRDDIHLLLTDNTGTDKITGIQLPRQMGEIEICLNSTSFSKMKNLIYFSSSGDVGYSGNIDYLSNNLRWLNWPGCPIQSFPSNFHPKELVALNIPDSLRLTRLWEGRKIFPKLTSMNLSGCASLMELPDFTGIPHLKELALVECESLVEVHHSVGSLDRLETLDAVECSKLVTLPREINLKSVQRISLINCERLEEFPKIIGKMDSLRKLDLSGSGIKDLHPSIRYLIGLKDLSLRWCKNLTTLPCSIDRLQNLENLDLGECSKFATFPKINRNMNSLRKLDLSGSGIKDLHPSITYLIGLKYLSLRWCKNLTTLPCSIDGLQNLEKLDLGECSRFATFPEINRNMNSLSILDLSGSGIKNLHPSITYLIGLKDLSLRWCKNLTTLPCSIDGLQNLEKLDLSECSQFATFPEINRKMDSLSILDLSRSAIEDLHPSIGYLIGLKDLSLSWCENLTTLPCSIDRLQNLEKLDLSECSKFATFPEINRKMDSFRKLDLSDTDIKELHPSIGNLIGLKDLFLSGCENLSTLPCSIYGLQNLEWLFLRGCTKLVTFPTKPKSLHDDNGDGSLSLPKLSMLIMNGCNLSDCDFLTTLDCLETLTQLDLSSNNFVSLPAFISKFVNLEKLDLHHCNGLREIPELPPNLVEVDLSDCKWINSLGYNMDKWGGAWLDNQFDLWNYERLSDYLGYNMDKLERISLKNHSRCIIRNLRSIIPNRKLSMERKSVG